MGGQRLALLRVDDEGERPAVGLLAQVPAAAAAPGPVRDGRALQPSLNPERRWSLRPYDPGDAIDPRAGEQRPSLSGNRIAPLGWQHVNLTGDYLWGVDNTLAPDGFRPLRGEPPRRAVA